jgi:hypothetical protein
MKLIDSAKIIVNRFEEFKRVGFSKKSWVLQTSTQRGVTVSRKDIIEEIADRALGGYDSEVDGTDIEKVARWFLSWYSSPDAPEPICGEVYQKVLYEEPERVYEAICEALQLSFA